MSVLSLRAIRGRVAATYELEDFEVETFQRARLTDRQYLKRPAYVVEARQVMVTIARRITQDSWPAIARVCGYQDHTSCISAARTIEKRIDDDEDFAKAFGLIERACVNDIANLSFSTVGWTNSGLTRELMAGVEKLSARLFAHVRDRPSLAFAAIERTLDDLDAAAARKIPLAHQKTRKGTSR